MHIRPSVTVAILQYCNTFFDYCKSIATLLKTKILNYCNTFSLRKVLQFYLKKKNEFSAEFVTFLEIFKILLQK